MSRQHPKIIQLHLLLNIISTEYHGIICMYPEQQTNC